MNIKSFFCLSLCCLSSSIFASTSWLPYSFHGLEFSGAVGPNWAQVTNTHLVVSPYETDSVRVNHVSNNVIWKVGAGFHFFAEQLQNRAFFNDFLVELNFYRSSENINGDVWQYRLPQFNNFRFKSYITNNRLMVDFKPRLFTQRNISVYPILGLGTSWNKVSYNETVTGVGIPAKSNYLLRSRTGSNFAYDLGVGLRTCLAEHLDASLEYLYTKFGNMSPSARSSNSDAIYAVPRFNIYNQSLLFGINWKI